MGASMYMSRKTLADALEISPSTVDDFVRRRIIPPPVKMSSGCVRWRWETVDRALLSLMDGSRNDEMTTIDEGARRAIEAAKVGGRGRVA